MHITNMKSDSPTNIDRQTARGRHTRFIAHLIVILMLFILPEIVMNYAMPQRRGFQGTPWGIYLKSLVFIAVFYINYYFIIERTLNNRVRVWRFIGLNLLVVVGSLGLCYVIWRYSFYLPRLAEAATRPIRHPERMQYMVFSSLVRDAVMVVLTIALSVALRLGDKWLTLERRRRDMLAEQRETELSNLKSQLNPHFLFNTLNTIYALVEINPDEARRAIHELSQLLRYVLYETPAEVSLERETEFTANYISLMELRLGPGHVAAHIDIDAMSGTSVPPLIFIPLVENAFKHGNTGHTDSVIEIDIKAADGQIVCRTVNSFDPHTVLDRRSGIGIANLRRRMHLIYGRDASLTTTIDTERYTSTLTIIIRPE